MNRVSRLMISQAANNIHGWSHQLDYQAPLMISYVLKSSFILCLHYTADTAVMSVPFACMLHIYKAVTVRHYTV